MSENPKILTSPAEKYTKGILAKMSASPGSCGLLDNLAQKLDVDNAVFVFGLSGSSPALARDTLLALRKIHEPDCSDFAKHNTFEGILNIYSP